MDCQYVKYIILFVPVEEPPYAGTAKEYVWWIECDSCGMWEHLECFEGDYVPDKTGFVHIAAKSWMIWLNTENV